MSDTPSRQPLPADVEKALRDSEASYRGLFNAIGQAIYIQDAQGRFVDVNLGAMEMYGYTREELVGQDPGFVSAEGMNDVEAVGKQVARAFAGEPQQFEFWGRRKNGEVFPKDVRLYKGTYFGQDVVIAVAADITERKRAEAALRESEERYRVLFEGINDAVFVNEVLADNSPGRFLQVNEVACQRLGYTRDELLQLTPRDITTAEAFSVAAPKRESLAQRGNTIMETVHVAKDGRRIPVESNIHFFRYLGRTAALSISRDITDRRHAEEERLDFERRMLHVQKLESLGVLAGGIAHDFNNILVAVLGYADLAMEELPEGAPVRERVAGIETAARRAADLCRQMLAYSGRGKFVIERLHLGDLVTGMAHLASASVSKRSRLNMDVARPLPPVEGDATQLRQVVMNLVTNASEALGDEGGVVTVRTSLEPCLAADLARMLVAEDPRDGAYVCLEVSDTGCGMTPETLDRIFDPFFTTKFTGRGLGMAAVLGIIRGHKGAIDVRSSVGEGTTFRVYLPASEAEPRRAAQGSGDRRAPWRGQGCVLVVDDEVVVRNVATLMLERAGFDVVAAADGHEAVRICREQDDRIALVLLDLTMPGMDGEATFRALRAVVPQVPVLMSSGFTEQEITARLAGQGLAGFVQKPYTQGALLATVRQALERH